MRRIALHASALSDAEYDLFTSSLRDIALADEDPNPKLNGGTGNEDDAFYERLSVGIREARAWLRGRYSHLPSATIDGILKLFSPTLAQNDLLSGTEFFAALRLVLHAESGREVDRSLVFVQVQPRTEPTKRSESPSKDSGPPPIRRATKDPPIQDPASHNPFSQPPLHPFSSQRSEASVKSSPHNPFVQRAPRSEDGASSSKPPLPPRKPTAPVPPPPRHVSLSSSKNRPDRSVSPTKSSAPPIPPPKPAHHVTSTLIKQSLQATKVAQSLKKAEEQLEKERVMQVLKSSSGAISHSSSNAPPLPSKVQKSASSGSDGSAPPLPRRRIHPRPPSPPISSSSMEQVALAVPPSRPSFPSSQSHRSTPSHHVISPFRAPTEPHISAIPFSTSTRSSPSRPTVDLPSGPPPTHPDRKPTLSITGKDTFESIYGTPVTSPNTNDSPTTRVFRSKSLHHPSPPPLYSNPSSLSGSTTPLPSTSSPSVQRRRRPESVQVLGSGEVLLGSSTLTRNNTIFGTSTPSRAPPPPPPKHHRRSSLSTTPSNTSSSYSSYATPSEILPSNINNATSTSSTGSNNPLSISHLQRTLMTLQPKLDKARYKAEAGLTRRGFVAGRRRRSGEEGEEEEGLVPFGGSSSDSGRVQSRGRVRENGLNQDVSDSDDGGIRGGVKRSPEKKRTHNANEDEDDDTWQRSRGIDSMRFVSGRSLTPSPGSDSPGSPLRSKTTKRVLYDDPPEQDSLKWPVDVDGEGWKPL